MFAIRNLVLVALLHSLFGITCSIYMNNDNGNDESVHEVLPKLHRFLCYAVVLVQFIVVQTCESREQVRKCSAVTSKLPYLHKAGPLWKPHFAMVLFVLTTPVRILLRHSQFFQGA